MDEHGILSDSDGKNTHLIMHGQISYHVMHGLTMTDVEKDIGKIH